MFFVLLLSSVWLFWIISFSVFFVVVRVIFLSDSSMFFLDIFSFSFCLSLFVLLCFCWEIFVLFVLLYVVVVVFVVMFVVVMLLLGFVVVVVLFLLLLFIVVVVCVLYLFCLSFVI